MMSSNKYLYISLIICMKSLTQINPISLFCQNSSMVFIWGNNRFVTLNNQCAALTFNGDNMKSISLCNEENNKLTKEFAIQ
jgi:hypothetical protein